jgi:hypothetical protein
MVEVVDGFAVTLLRPIVAAAAAPAAAAVDV